MGRGGTTRTATRRYELRHVPRAGGRRSCYEPKPQPGLISRERLVTGGITPRHHRRRDHPDASAPAYHHRAARGALGGALRPRRDPSDQAAFGAGLSYEIGPVSAAVGGARVITDAGPEYRLGGGWLPRQRVSASARYLRSSSRTGSATDRLRGDPLPTGGRLARARAALLSKVSSSRASIWRTRQSPAPWSAKADVTTDGTRGVTGSARLAYDLPGALGATALEHERLPVARRYLPPLRASFGCARRWDRPGWEGRRRRRGARPRGLPQRGCVARRGA